MQTIDAANILYRKWEAVSPKAVVLCIHGLGAHSGRWESLAEFLVKRDITSYALELKGFGETTGLKGDVDSFNIYAKDIVSLAEVIKTDLPDKKVFLLGESLGGLLAFLAAASCATAFDGLICISPAFKSRLKFSCLEYIRMFFANVFTPRRQFVVPFTAQMCTRDVEYQKALEEDEREHRLATARFLVNTRAAQMRAQFVKGRLAIPTLFLIAGQDCIVDARVSLNVFKKLNTKDKTVIQYPEMSHALSIDLGKEKVFEDIVAWLAKRVV